MVTVMSRIAIGMIRTITTTLIPDADIGHRAIGPGPGPGDGHKQNRGERNTSSRHPVVPFRGRSIHG